MPGTDAKNERTPTGEPRQWEPLWLLVSGEADEDAGEGSLAPLVPFEGPGGDGPVPDGAWMVVLYDDQGVEVGATAVQPMFPYLLSSADPEAANRGPFVGALRAEARPGRVELLHEGVVVDVIERVEPFMVTSVDWMDGVLRWETAGADSGLEPLAVVFAREEGVAEWEPVSARAVGGELRLGQVPGLEGPMEFRVVVSNGLAWDELVAGPFALGR